MIILLIVAYLIGSIPSALIVGKIFFNADIREHGSGNLGTTNTLRIVGLRGAFAVAVFDVLIKGTFITIIAVILFNKNIVNIPPILIGMMSVLGHIFPIFAKFKGGKGVATSVGILIALNLKVAIIAIFLIFFILLITKMMSLASLITLIVSYNFLAFSENYSTVLTIVANVYVLFILIMHHANIKRIIKREEKKIDIINIIKEKIKKTK